MEFSEFYPDYEKRIKEFSEKLDASEKRIKELEDMLANKPVDPEPEQNEPEVDPLTTIVLNHCYPYRKEV